MTTRRTPSPAEMPSEGGSYVRQPGGALKRVEATEQAPIADAPAPPPTETEEA